MYIYVYLDKAHIKLSLCWTSSALETVLVSLQREGVIYFISLEWLKEQASSALTINSWIRKSSDFF